MSKIDPSEYMVGDSWKYPGPPVAPYKRGSRHNKIGMTIMWAYYVLFVGMVIRLIVVLNS